MAATLLPPNFKSSFYLNLSPYWCEDTEYWGVLSCMNKNKLFFPLRWFFYFKIWTAIIFKSTLTVWADMKALSFIASRFYQTVDDCGGCRSNIRI